MPSIYLLSNMTHKDAKSLGVISIRYLNPTILQRDYEAIVFTSKNAVFAIDKIYKNWKNLQIFSIGEGTSKAVKECNAQVHYESTISYGEEFADEIIPFLKSKRVLFPHAKEVVSDICDRFLSNDIDVDEAIVYETICSKEDKTKPEKDSIIIFTSPSTVECFFKRYEWDESYQAIAIGKKTAQVFPENIKVYISNKQSINSCVEFASKLSKDSL